MNFRHFKFVSWNIENLTFIDLVQDLNKLDFFHFFASSSMRFRHEKKRETKTSIDDEIIVQYIAQQINQIRVYA